MDKSADAFRTISEAAEELDVPQHVLRFWETRFAQIKPMKRGGGRRYYRPDDMELLRAIRHLLYGEGYTIRGVQRMLKEHGVKTVVALRAAGGLPSADASGVRHPADEADDGADEAAEAGGAEEAFLPDLSPEAERSLRAALAEVMEARRVLRAARSS